MGEARWLKALAAAPPRHGRLRRQDQRPDRQPHGPRPVAGVMAFRAREAWLPTPNVTGLGRSNSQISYKMKSLAYNSRIEIVRRFGASDERVGIPCSRQRLWVIPYVGVS